LSKLFDRLRNAARLRGGAGADHSLLAQALQRAAQERAQSRAAADPPAPGPANETTNDPANETASEADYEDWAKSLAANDDVNSKFVAAVPNRPDHDTHGSSRRRVARGIAGAVALLIAVAALIGISVYLARTPPAPVPVFQIDKTLR
jgi:hypothetical protein